MKRLAIIGAALALLFGLGFTGHAWKWGQHHPRVADTDGWTWDGGSALDTSA